MKIHIFVRHCNFSTNSVKKNRPEWFNREGCWQNLLNTINPNLVNITVCFDGKVDKEHFLNKYNTPYYKKWWKLIEFENGGNDGASFLNMINYIEKQNIDDNDIIYLVEDDYLHKQNWYDILIEGFEEINIDYITLYDHNDKYWYPMYADLMSKIICTKNSHWKSIPNTTNTYACLFKTFKNDLNIQKEFCDLEKGYTRDFDKFQHLMNIGRTLVNPIPGYSTHCETEYMSPVVNWEKIFKETSKYYNEEINIRV